MKKTNAPEEVVEEQPTIVQPSMANILELKAYAYDLLAGIEERTNALRQVNDAIRQAQQEIADVVKENPNTTVTS